MNLSCVVEQFLHEAGWKFEKIREDSLVAGQTSASFSAEQSPPQAAPSVPAENGNSPGYIYRANIKIEKSVYKMFFFAREPQQQFQMLVTTESQYVPKICRTAVAEFLMRVNYRLVIGNFEMDMDDGEVRFRIAVDAGQGLFNLQMIKQMTYLGIVMMDRYSPGMMEICYSGTSPKEVLEKIGNGC
jgi:hypothetical protein